MLLRDKGGPISAAIALTGHPGRVLQNLTFHWPTKRHLQQGTDHVMRHTSSTPRSSIIQINSSPFILRESVSLNDVSQACHHTVIMLNVHVWFALVWCISVYVKSVHESSSRVVVRGQGLHFSLLVAGHGRFCRAVPPLEHEMSLDMAVD